MVECSVLNSCELDRSQFDSQENNELMDAVTDVSPCTAGVPYEAVWEISKLAPISEDCDPPNVYDSETPFVFDSVSSIVLITG